MAGTTTRGAFPYPSPSDPDDVPADLQVLAQRIASIGVLFLPDSTQALRPAAAAGNAAHFHRSTDTGVLAYSTGSTWLQVVLAAGLRDLVVANQLTLDPLAPTTVREGGQVNFAGALLADGVARARGHAIDQYDEQLRFVAPDGVALTVDPNGLCHFRAQVQAPSLTQGAASAGAQVSTTSTTYVDLGGPDVAYTVPASRRVLVHLTASLLNPSQTYAFMSCEVFDVGASGVYIAAADDRAVYSQGSDIRATASVLVDHPASHVGLPMVVRPRYRAGSNTAQFLRRAVVVQPSP